ncbi:hypothetical protein QFZ28_003302 [Neobacillus niacini]|nr:hypothetical protein [Neobacillus niacini]
MKKRTFTAMMIFIISRWSNDAFSRGSKTI